MLGRDPRYSRSRERRVARELTGLGRAPRLQPSMIVSDNGTEFTSNAHARLDAGQHDRVAYCLRQQGRCRTASVRASTAACATSFSTRACSLTLTMRDQGLRMDRTITTSGGPHSAAGLPHAGGAYAANLTATCDRLRNPDQLSRSHVAPLRAPRRKNPGRGSKRRWMKKFSGEVSLGASLQTAACFPG